MVYFDTMTKLLLVIYILLFGGCSTQPNVNNEIISEEYGPIIVGLTTWDGLVEVPYGDWFVTNYKNYVVDSTTLNAIQSLSKIKIVLYMGTWCEDSQVQVPEFFKMMDYLKYDINNMMVIGLEKKPDGKLVSPTNEEEGMNITHVPSFLFYKNGKELGRIVEFPELTLEKDMLAILEF